MKVLVKRLNFNDKKKAKIFELDHAICAFTGKSLWMLDYGVDFKYEIDWVDHIKPASKGGSNAIENGVLACWSSNYLAGNRKKKYICKRGKILLKADIKETERKKIIKNINRLSKIKESDWFLNRALWHIMIAANQDWNIKNGSNWSRDKKYWMKSSQKKIDKWRKLDLDGYQSLVKRGLIPLKPNSGQKVMLQLIKEKDPKKYKLLSNKLFNLFQKEIDKGKGF